MDILFRDKKLLKCANDHRKAQKTMGQLRAKKFVSRLTELRDADCLEDLRNLPQAGFHELKGDRKGELAGNLDHPYRLIFEPFHDPVPQLEAGGLDWKAVTAVEITEIVDYHE